MTVMQDIQREHRVIRRECRAAWRATAIERGNPRTSALAMRLVDRNVNDALLEHDGLVILRAIETRMSADSSPWEIVTWCEMERRPSHQAVVARHVDDIIRSAAKGLRLGSARGALSTGTSSPVGSVDSAARAGRWGDTNRSPRSRAIDVTVSDRNASPSIPLPTFGPTTPPRGQREDAG